MSVSSSIPHPSPDSVKKPALPSESIPLDETRWANWVAKNRLADQRSAAQRAKWLMAAVAALAVGATLYWMR